MKAKVIAIALAVVVWLGGGFFAAKYIAGTTYFLANKTKPVNITLDTWQQYWEAYPDNKVQRQKLKASAGVAVFLVYLIPLFALLSLGKKGRSLHGDARFATTGEIRESGLINEKGIIVGQANGQVLMFPGQEFVMLAAPTRSGKGVAVVIPNLLNWSDSLVVLDIKLENFKITSGFRAAHGQEVFLFSPFAEDGRTHRWNPLDAISRDPNFMIGDIQTIAQTLYPTDKDKDTFWNEQACNLFMGLCLYLLETPELPCTLGELLRQSSGKGQPIKDYITRIINERSKSEKPLSDVCVDSLSRFISTSDNTLSSIVATFNAPLNIFANPIVDAATSASDFNIADVRRRRMSIYIGIQPNRLSSAALLVNLFFSQLVNLNTAKLPQDDPSLKYQCLLILDEFTALGKVGILAKSVSFIAGYNLRLLPIIQSVAQLESVYGEKDTRTFVTNHAVQILYPPREQKDANEYSEMLGYFTQKETSTSISRPRSFGAGGPGSDGESTSSQRRALMLPQELKELGQDKEIIIKENTKPILCEKARYFSDARFMDRLKTVSPTLAALGSKLPSYDELKHAAFVRNELCSRVPVLDINRHRALIEQRTRDLNPGEAIDLSKLAIKVEDLPALDDQKNPSTESVTNLVDAFFSQLQWAEPAHA